MQRKIALIGLALMVVASSHVFGQAQRGTISVTVTSADDGSLLPGATIEARSDQTLTSRLEATGTNGRTELVALDPATNYIVTVTLEGFAPARIEDVRVRAGQSTNLNVELQLSEFGEEMVITGESPVVDTTSTTAGQEITLELTEALPTGRSYQSYLQLVPGVQDALGTTQNPASRSGINYRDVDGAEGDVGRSTDNLYYFDGINVTDRTEGTNGADLNTEIIQEQSILTGAIPAEYIGVPGLVSNVVTKSGGNDFSGSVNYYFIDDSLVEDNEHFPDETFSNVDTAATLGGPIFQDKAWFFASFRRVENERGVVNEQGTFLRDASQEADQAFGKATWSITNKDLVTGIYLTDPTERDANFNRAVPNTADSVGESGGERWSLSYNRVWGSAAFEAGATDHFADLNSFPKNREPAASVSFAPGIPRSSTEERLGGSGLDNIVERSTDSVRGSFEYLFDTGWGDHAVKVGAVDWSSTLFENPQTVGDPPATYISLNLRGTSGSVQLCEILGSCAPNSWSIVDFGASSDEINNFNTNITEAQRQTLIAAGWDEDGDGFFSGSELANNMTFSSTLGNPQGMVNYTRDLQTQAGPSEKSSESTHFFIQDSWQWNKWSVNAGVRVEDTTFIDDTGADVGTFDTEVAPRISIAYDLKGNGRSSVGVFYGEYYDAFRDNAIDFAGSLQGRVIEEQVWVEPLNDWVNFRFRGGTAVQDAFFAPRIETPVTEEIQLQFKQDLGRNMMFEINLIDRETTGIAEDYGSLYYNPADYAAVGGNADDPNDAFFLGPGFFGFGSLGEIPTNLNFLIGTLPSAAFREWRGAELIFRKRYSDNWQMLASYNYADAEGNSNSDSNFDGAGDVIFLDPRAPNRTGTQPGLVEHLFKLHGSYRWNNGIQAGLSYRWNSGVILNRNEGQAFSRSLPDRAETQFPFGGWSGGTFEDTWIAADALGFIEGNSYSVLDLRGSYVWTPGNRIEVDLFLDVFNTLDDQAVVRVQDLVSGGAGVAYLDGIEFLAPRRYNLGARLRF